MYLQAQSIFCNLCSSCRAVYLLILRITVTPVYFIHLQIVYVYIKSTDSFRICLTVTCYVDANLQTLESSRILVTRDLTVLSFTMHALPLDSVHIRFSTINTTISETRRPSDFNVRMLFAL